MMRFLITGATGLVGEENWLMCDGTASEVHFLTTNRDKSQNSIHENYQGFYWNPGKRGDRSELF